VVAVTAEIDRAARLELIKQRAEAAKRELPVLPHNDKNPEQKGTK